MFWLIIFQWNFNESFGYLPQSSFLICPSSSCRTTVPLCEHWTMLTTTPSTSNSDLGHKRQQTKAGEWFTLWPDFSVIAFIYKLLSLTWQWGCHRCPEQGGASAGWRRLAAGPGGRPQTAHPAATAAAAGPGSRPAGMLCCEWDGWEGRSRIWGKRIVRTQVNCSKTLLRNHQSDWAGDVKVANQHHQRDAALPLTVLPEGFL